MDKRPSDMEAVVRNMVRSVVQRTLGEAAANPTAVSRPLIDETTVRQMPAHTRQPIPPNALVTPLARQVALERHVTLETATPSDTAVAAAQNVNAGRAVALGADHGGYGMKEALKKTLVATGLTVIDCGTHSTDSVDYPDYAYAVAQLVATSKVWRGIIIDGAGIGSCMTANKVPGVRAAMCYDQATAVNSREHNNANVLTLGAGLIGQNLANQIVTTWLNTEFAGGRHARRVDKIDAIGRRFSKERS